VRTASRCRRRVLWARRKKNAGAAKTNRAQPPSRERTERAQATKNHPL
jgi:hypothetical protein